MFRTNKIAAGTLAALSIAATAAGLSACSGTIAQPDAIMADKATQVTMTITNSTNQKLLITSSVSKGTKNAWQDRAGDLDPGATEIVSNYAAWDAEIDLVFTGADDGTQFTMMGETPSGGSNIVDGSSNNPSYTVATQSDTGFNPSFKYNIQAGHTFSYTGHTENYTVPAGTHHLKVDAIGGSGGYVVGAAGHVPSGAEIKGVLSVNPGDVLTIGVADLGGNVYNNASGGWGMAAGGSSYSGGNGTSGSDFTCGGGGATVITDNNGTPLVVAGGAGGMSAGGGGEGGLDGGEGGAGGTLLGGNGQPGVNSGGAPGASSSTQGQDTTSGGASAGGAGGGGVKGGMAGISGTNGGGGAGSSYDADLTGVTIDPAPSSLGRTVLGTVILTDADAS